MNQDDDKQTAQLIAHGEMSSLETQQPFPVILQETMCMTGLFEGILEMAIDSMKIFK